MLKYLERDGIKDAFSSPHTLAYSLIAMEQLNLNMRYSPVYWQTAVLTANSGSQEVDEGEKTKTTEYGKMASAIGDLKSLGVKIEPPLINKANFSFTPDAKNNRIIFSLKGITTVGDGTVNEIIENRPYSSFDDFYERMCLTKKVQRSQVINLIKAGCFNEFDSQFKIMRDYLVKEIDVKDRLNGQNMSRIISLGLLEDEHLQKYKKLFEVRAKLKKNVHEKLEKPKNRILFVKGAMDNALVENYFGGSCEVGYGSKGEVLIDEKKFEKEYKELMEPLMSHINSKEFLSKFNNAQFMEVWEKDASGTIPSWQMSAVSFYESEHELEHIQEETYNIVDFHSLSEEPIVESEYEWRGRTRQNYQLFSIAGTVLEKNKNNHTATILTKYGVVTCKMWGGSFSHYDRQIKVNGRIEERSWFTRGNLLLLKGFKRGQQFILKSPKGEHTISLINGVSESGLLGLRYERARGE